MYDVHCHILPDFDDGADNLEVSLSMARMAVEDGITHLACTPHIYPGLFDYDTESISKAVNSFSKQLESSGIPLTLCMGADIQMVSEILPRLREGSMPTINNSRYLLFEPPHHLAPVGFEEAIYNILASDYVPVITHPERLAWIEDHYTQFIDIVRQGAWLQVTAGSLSGVFGARPQYWAERMLSDGIVHLLASDGHNMTTRAPLLSEGRELASKLVGDAESYALVTQRPKAIWNNEPVDQVSRPPAFETNEIFHRASARRPTFFKRLFPGSGI